MKVLHSLESFLNRTENWLLPQIVDVPNVEGAVLCKRVVNAGEFSLRGSRLFVETAAVGSNAFLARAFRFAIRRTRLAAAYDRRRIANWSPTLIHAHFGPRGLESLPLKRRLRIPLVTTFYGFDAWMLPKVEPEWLRRYAELFRDGDLFVVEGPAMRQRLIDIGCPPEKTLVRPIGVELPSLTFTSRDLSNGLRIAMVGRFVEKKGFVDGLRACADAAARGVDLTVTVIGDSAGDPVGEKIKHELRTIASSPELSGRVQFAGFVPQTKMWELLREQNTVLCPSRHSSNGDAEGGLPFVLTEAMALGLLGIASRHCDAPEAIIDQKTGYLFDEGHTGQLTDILCAVFANPGKVADITRAGRKLVEKKYNLAEQLKALSAIYAQAVRQHRSQGAHS